MHCECIRKQKEISRQRLAHITRLSYLSEQFPFTTVETEIDFYQQELKVQVATPIAKRLNI